MSGPCNGTVLVIDDEPDNLRLIVEILRDHGLELVSARSGADGLRIARALRPDLILLDVGMPGQDGYAVCRELKADAGLACVPVIFLTAHGRLEDRLRGLEAGGVDYVCKPFDARELLLRVLNHLRLVRQLAARPAAGAAVATDAAPQLPGGALSVLMRARDQLLARLDNPPDLATLARLAGSNRTSLQALFKEHLGMSVFRYLREQRLQQAWLLFERGGRSVDEVAAQVGYSSGSELARAFRRRFGCAPSERLQDGSVAAGPP